jgi:hypothetical protein
MIKEEKVTDKEKVHICRCCGQPVNTVNLAEEVWKKTFEKKEKDGN